MKKIMLGLVMICISLTFQPTQLSATEISKGFETPLPKEETDVMIQRLNEINNMDKSALSHTEKRELRKEVREIDKKLREAGGGIYISVGALLIIILLLIILF